MTQSITGIDDYTNVWTLAPDDFAPAKALDIRATAAIALNNTRHLYLHSVLDTVARPGGNSGTFAFTGTPGIIAGFVQIQAAEIGGLAMPNGSTPTITAEGTTGRIVCEDLQANRQPARADDPGADNLVTGPNVCKAWAYFTIGQGSVTIHDGYNIDDIEITGIPQIAKVTFARAMANATYAVTWGYDDADDVTARVPSKAAGDFTFNLYEMSTNNGGMGPHDLDTEGPFDLQFVVFGRQ